MCEYFSGILCEDGKVLYLPDSMNHVDIEEKYKLAKADAGKKYVPFELVPDYKKLLEIQTRQELNEKLRDIFTLKWDFITLPKWVEKNTAKLVAACWAALEDSAKTNLLFGNETLQELKDGRYVYLMCGSAQIGSVFGSAQIKYVFGSAQIGSVSGSAQIGSVYGSAQIEEVFGSAQIKCVSGSAQIGSVYGSAQIKSLKEQARAIKNNVIYLAKKAKTKQLGTVPA